MFRYDVLCVGSATVDHFLTTSQPFKKIKLGDKVIINSMETHSGGGATNSAVALAKMGLKVKIFAKLGNDHNGDFILKELKTYGIKNRCKYRSKKPTDFATIISSEKDKDRIIYIHKGASKDISINDCKQSLLKTKWIYLACCTGKSFSLVKVVTEYAKKHKIKLLFNPPLYLTKKSSKLKSILKNTEILVLNKEEAQALTNKQTNTKQLLKELNTLGSKTIIITDGPNPVHALKGNQFYSVKVPNVKIVQTAGAGDAFTSGLLAGMIKKYSFSDALCLGVANALSVIQHIGTKNKLLTEKEAKIMIKKYKIKS